MGGTCNTDESEEKFIKMLPVNLKGKDNLENLGLDGSGFRDVRARKCGMVLQAHDRVKGEEGKLLDLLN
jgi:hypothetical protein